MAENRAILQKLGLNEKEVSVYLAALELGIATVQELSKKSGVKRTSIYNFLDHLKSLGLVSELRKNNRQLIVCEDPESLKQAADQKITEAKEHKKIIETVIPDLLAVYAEPGKRPGVKFFEGIEGIKKVYEDTLLEDSAIHAFTDYEKMMEVMDFDYMLDYAKRRTETGINFFSIGPGGAWANKAQELSVRQKREMKIIKEIQFDTEINIYGNKIGLISFRRPYSAVIVEDRALAQTLQTVWKLLWKKL